MKFAAIGDIHSNVEALQAELMTSAMTAPALIPLAIRICDTGIMADRRIYKGMSHQESPPKYVEIHSVGTTSWINAPMTAPNNK